MDFLVIHKKQFYACQIMGAYCMTRALGHLAFLNMILFDIGISGKGSFLSKSLMRFKKICQVTILSRDLNELPTVIGRNLYFMLRIKVS